MDQSLLKYRSHLRFQHENVGLRMTVLDVICPDCKGESALAVSTTSLEEWLTTRGLIQVLFPELSSFQREQLITGYCQACWDAMWAEEEL